MCPSPACALRLCSLTTSSFLSSAKRDLSLLKELPQHLFCIYIRAHLTLYLVLKAWFAFKGRHCIVRTELQSVLCHLLALSFFMSKMGIAFIPTSENYHRIKCDNTCKHRAWHLELMLSFLSWKAQCGKTRNQPDHLDRDSICSWATIMQQQEEKAKSIMVNAKPWTKATA